MSNPKEPREHDDYLSARERKVAEQQQRKLNQTSGEVNAHNDLDLVLFRPVGCVYRVLRCENCRYETFEISLADNGQWNLECGNCYEVAAVLSEVLAKLR